MIFRLNHYFMSHKEHRQTLWHLREQNMQQNYKSRSIPRDPAETVSWATSRQSTNNLEKVRQKELCALHAEMSLSKVTECPENIAHSCLPWQKSRQQVTRLRSQNSVAYRYGSNLMDFDPKWPVVKYGLKRRKPLFLNAIQFNVLWTTMYSGHC